VGVPMLFKDLIKTSKLKALPFKEFDYKNNHVNIGGGIYRMYNKTGKIIYVGKSKDLHRRLHQHFGKDTNTAYFIDEVDFVEVLIEPSPFFQTLLEAIFIALHKPKYNNETKDSQGGENHGEKI
jgi:excinuclease UvrABC nuclease subunit